MSKEWVLNKKRIAYQTPHRLVEEWEMQNQNGHADVFSIHLSNDVVVVFGMTDDKKVLVLNQFFISHQKKLFTLVAGMLEKGEDRKKTVERELREETGCVAKEIIELGSACESKWSTGKAYFYLATGIEQKYSQDLEQSEDIDVVFMSIDEFKELLNQSKLHGLCSTTTAYKALYYLNEL